MSRRARRRWIAVVTLLMLAALGFGARKAIWWYNFAQPVTRDSWLVRLPGGGSIRYANRSPRMRILGPADTEKTLTWFRSAGPPQPYPIASIGGGYEELEVRLRKDGQAVWLVSPGEKSVVATLDLRSGKFASAGGAVYDARGEQSTDESGTPGWATTTGGRVLAHRRFR